uniref:Ephrin RBD domain-containing protein n=1 Tax=Heterorhabditis bacteriophora TaxID=37862 RepID=A0A1I7XKA3_HETBA
MAQCAENMPNYRIVVLNLSSSSGYVERYAAIGDSLDIICPYYDDGTDPQDTEQSIIYRVSEEDYERCALSSSVRELGRCTAPYKRDKVKVTFRLMSPNPSGLDYRPGTTYYFISTSTGSISGFENPVGGMCASHNLKMVIHVTDKNGDIAGHVHRHHLHKKTTTETPKTEKKWLNDPLWGQFFEKVAPNDNALWKNHDKTRGERLTLDQGDSKDAYEAMSLPLEEAVDFQIHEIGDMESLFSSTIASFSVTSVIFFLLISLWIL